MENNENKVPVQARAIEKKERILKSGFNLICQNGYHNVDCIQIAKSADVSTGTVYRYFTDKREIFLEGLKENYKEKLFPILKFKNKKIEKNTLKDLIQEMIDVSIKSHHMTKTSHEEIMAMRHSDSDVEKIFEEYELEATSALVEILKDNNISNNHLQEKAHLIIYWIDDLCHEIIYHKHKNFDYKIMEELVVDSILNLLK